MIHKRDVPELRRNETRLTLQSQRKRFSANGAVWRHVPRRRVSFRLRNRD